MRSFYAFIILLLLGATSYGQLSNEERKGVRDALYLGNMNLKDLEWERKAFTPPFLLPIVSLSLDKPLEAADVLMEVHSKADRSVAMLIGVARMELLGDVDVPPPLMSEVPFVRIPETVPSAYRDPLMRMVTSLALANVEVKQALAKLTAAERRELIEGLPKWACPEFDYEFVKSPTKDQATLLGLIAKVDLPRIRAAAQQLASSVEGPMRAMKKLAETHPFHGEVRFTEAGVSVEFDGVEDDNHSERDAQLTIDLGGNDRYTGRHGAGPGYASVLMDLGGDDVYDVPDLSVGAAVTGIGVAFDLGGNDVFRGKSLCFGAGLAGVGVFYKESGDDVYSGAAMAEGFGALGIGLCVDTSGSDRYQASLNAQGAASTGGVGWLIDREGDDTYRAGGKILNSPLFADVHYSNAQGFGTGYREDTGGLGGGVGLLTDLLGDDAYIGETYCQAASYWFGLGSLYDAKGHDTYRAYHYAQASAMHLCGALLFDLAGDDSYSVSWGAAFAIGHDFGVAFFLDRSGNDLYASRDAGPGSGNANGLGVFIESSGQDRYTGVAASANPARGTGSLGLFVDMNGPDKFMDGFANGTGRVTDQWGVAYAADTHLSPDMIGAQPPAQRAKPVPNSKPMPDEKAVEQLYRRATQWAVGTAVQEAAQANDSLIEIGVSALKWMIEKKLSNASRLEQSSYMKVADALGTEGKQLLAAQIGATLNPPPQGGRRDVLDKSRVIPALGACIDGGFKEAGPFLPKAMQQPETARLAARAAGTLGGKECVSDLMLLCASQEKMTALAALVSLSQIGDESAYGTAAAFITSDSLPMRKAAMQLMAKFPEKAILNGRTLASDPDERMTRIGIELLGLIGTAEALSMCGAKLEDARPGVLIQALLALDGRCPLEFRQRFLALREDVNPLVRAVALRVDFGR